MYLGGAISEITDLDTELKRRIGAALASVIRYSSNCTTDGTQDYRPRSGFQRGGSGSYTVQMYHVDSPCVCHTPHCLLFILLLSPFPSIVSLPLCGAFVALVLVFLSGLCSTAYMTAFLAWPAEENIMWLSSVCSFCFHLSFVPCFFSLLSPFLVTTSLAGFFHVRFLQSASICLFLLDCAPRLICFGFVYLVATTGFAADQLL